jgi:tRNA(Ile)-lysidine synthase
MARTHPPSLITLTAATLREEGLAPRGTSVLVAVSGGPDSMALLHVLARLRSKHGFSLFAHGIDHGLRPEAPAELDLAEALARALDVPFRRTRVDVAAGGNLQARARKARYAALHAAAREVGATRVATGHHADDRAETLLMRILRGAGPGGLAVLPPIAAFPIPVRTPADDAPIYLVRPLVRARRAEVEAHIARHGIRFAEDPSNAQSRYLRTRVRKELMPILTALDPRVVEHLCALADDLAPLAVSPALPFRIPRPTLLALERLARAPRHGEQVALPGGLVATLDRAHAPLRVSPNEPNSLRSLRRDDAARDPAHSPLPTSAPKGTTRRAKAFFQSGNAPAVAMQNAAARGVARADERATPRNETANATDDGTGEKATDEGSVEKGEKPRAASVRNVKAAARAWEEDGVDQLDEAVARC